MLRARFPVPYTDRKSSGDCRKHYKERPQPSTMREKVAIHAPKTEDTGSASVFKSPEFVVERRFTQKTLIQVYAMVTVTMPFRRCAISSAFRDETNGAHIIFANRGCLTPMFKALRCETYSPINVEELRQIASTVTVENRTRVLTTFFSLLALRAHRQFAN